ncbi:MAG TPA: prolyl oligopeptidase family serine peptidase [Geobacteraceae bacterium]|nr:prolyl oligopeptidase family serine peptidase [Geobacteraceae bacterium]
MTELSITSILDGSSEKSLFFFPNGKTGVPLIVGLHTWSYNRFNQVEQMLPYCRERGWALLLPEFRGPNLSTNPRVRQACASPIARQDILDALDKVAADYPIDGENVFLLGGSGGGHMALMMAAHAPAQWKGVSAWVPITDLAAWHGENPEYAGHVAACCGGSPGTDPETDREYIERSPIKFVKELASVNLSLHHGRYDPVVPYGHSWKLALELEKLGAERFFFEIFDGEHDIHYEMAFHWFDMLLGREEKIGKKLTG